MSWWRRGAIYEIYPRSFQDSDGDGIGDLRGIAARVPYLRDLGVDAIWLTPIYPSPQRDFGYDITDHCDVDPQYGTLADFDTLVRQAHAQDLRVILDYVPNHTSDLHPWFTEHPERYLWRDGPPPNNWIGVFGGPPGSRTRTTGGPTITPTCASSPTSTGATRPCARRCTTSCASGSIAASTASASTRCASCSRTRSCATTRRTRTTRPACPSTTR